MGIHCKEAARADGLVYVDIFDDKGEAVSSRYVSLDAWDKDPEAIAAVIADNLAAVAAAQADAKLQPVVTPKEVVMTDKQVSDKLTEIREEKAETP